MAKAKENKSELIRSILSANPTMTAKEVVAKLKENGVDATEGLVYAVKQKLKPAATTKATKAAPAAQTPAEAAPSNGVLSIGDGIAEVKALAKKVGGLSELQKIVVALHRD